MLTNKLGFIGMCISVTASLVILVSGQFYGSSMISLVKQDREAAKQLGEQIQQLKQDYKQNVITEDEFAAREREIEEQLKAIEESSTSDAYDYIELVGGVIALVGFGLSIAGLFRKPRMASIIGTVVPIAVALILVIEFFSADKLCLP